MKKTVLSIILICALLFAALPMTVFAQTADTAAAGAVIAAVEAAVTEPFDGAAASFSASFPENAGYGVSALSLGYFHNGMTWHNDTDGVYLEESGAFEEGKEYTVMILIEAAGDDEFDENAVGRINGESAEISFIGSTMCYLSRTFTARGPVVIDTVAVQGVTAPVSGEKPVFAATLPEDAGYELNPDGSGEQYNGVRWTATNGRTTYLTSDDAFVAGKTYTAQVYIRTSDDGHKLSTSGLTATVNGKKASISYSRNIVSSTSCIVSCSFICTGRTYSLWLGKTQVSDDNKNDILGDGKASYDPDLKILTLDDPTIGGSYTVGSDSYKIYTNYSDLTVKGSYHMTSAETEKGVYSTGGLALDGDFTFMAADNAVGANQSLTVRSGSLKAISENDAISSAEGTVRFDSGVTKVEAKSESGCGVTARAVEIDSALTVTSPAGAVIGQDPDHTMNQAILEPDGAAAAKYAVIEKADEGSTVTVNVTSFLDSAEPVTLTLSGGSTFTAAAAGNSASNIFTAVPDGTYTLTVSKKDHVTREYEITVSGDTAVEAKIHPLGDISGDGKITNLDFARANSHVKGVVLLSGYELKCADVVKNDGLITNLDAGRINSHVKGVAKLW